MALRAKKPETIEKRLKLFLFGEAGVGKSTAAIQFPNSYIIDSERGIENYDKMINASQSVVLQTTDIEEVITEVRSLLTESHTYRTLVIDPISPIFFDLLEQCELKVGSQFGRHYGEAAKHMKRLINLIMRLDMNVIVTSHAKNEYGDEMKKTGTTFDAWKRMDYMFDLVLQLERRGPKRYAIVRKTRLEAFPDGEAFEWSYAEFEKRTGKQIGAQSRVEKLATPEAVEEFFRLTEVITLPEDWVAKALRKAAVDRVDEMTEDQVAKCINFMHKRIEVAA